MERLIPFGGPAKGRIGNYYPAQAEWLLSRGVARRPTAAEREAANRNGEEVFDVPIIPTVKVRRGDGFVIINEADFNPEKHELYEESGDESTLGPDEIAFASDSAREVAEEAGLSPEDFSGIDPSGKTGFTAADVRSIAEAKTAGGDEE